MLIVLALATLGAAGCTASAATADGFGQGQPCSYVLPGSTVPPKVTFTTVPGSPFIPPADEFTDTEKEPLSDFSASANWGDGTTSPANVGGEVGCYKVQGPSHTYMTPGTYTFSYTVRDAHTGLEHTVGGEPLDILSALPTPVPGTTPSIKASVGVPWSGVVAEFDETVIDFDLSYTASIEWGDGQVSPGTISQPPGETPVRLAVGGAHTFAAPLTSAIKVTIRGGIETGTWTVADISVSEVPSPFKLIGAPILAEIHSARGGSRYETIFRVNRRLPQASSGHVEASFLADGLTSPVEVFGSHRARACYAASERAPASPRRGQHYSFTLSFQQPTVSHTRGEATLRTYHSTASLLADAHRRLGC